MCPQGHTFAFHMTVNTQEEKFSVEVLGLRTWNTSGMMTNLLGYKTRKIRRNCYTGEKLEDFITENVLRIPESVESSSVNYLLFKI